MDRMQQMLVMKVVSPLTSRCFIRLILFFHLILLYGYSFPFIYTFACHIHQENKEGLELLKTAIAKAGYTSQVSFYNTFNVLADLSYLLTAGVLKLFSYYVRLLLEWMLPHLNFMGQTRPMI